MVVLGLHTFWFLFALGVILGLGAWAVFLWSIRTGQFRDSEGTAERMLELEQRD